MRHTSKKDTRVYQAFKLASKMSESLSVVGKVNPLMNFFLKREAPQPLSQKKPVKKVKPNEDKLNDPLYQILAWRDDITMPTNPINNSSRSIHEKCITLADPQKWGNNLQGIFMNIDWNTTSMEDLKKLTIPNGVLSNGMIFIWGSKTNLGQLMDYLEQMGYIYAQNFAFVLLSRTKIPSKSQKQLAGNKSLLNFFSRGSASSAPKEERLSTPKDCDYEVGKVSDPSEIFLNSTSQYFSESQKVLYMFRKINKKQSLQLRHQRTSDVFFTIGQDLRIDTKAKQVVYKMIETLLVNANYTANQPLKLLELWATKDSFRKGWITVSEEESQHTDKIVGEK